MEILIIITSLFIGVSVSCASQHVHVSSPLDHRAQELQLINHPTLPRKLKLNEVVVLGYGVKDKVSYNNYKPKEAFAEKHRKEAENEMRARRGTWQEWVQGTDSSEFFTMDYSHVRRRRPIHNKSLPIAP